MESVGDLEERLVARCRRMSSCQWKDVEMPVLTSHRNMTLLHLAAALGYPRLICALIHWREENSSPILDLEVDALSKDEVGFTPLVRSILIIFNNLIGIYQFLEHLTYIIICVLADVVLLKRS